MAPPRTYRVEALTLKHIPLGEADLLVTLYSRERGKLRAVAKGARRSVSKLVGHLEPLTLVNLALAQGRSLDIVSQAVVLENFTSLKADLNAITRGFYVAELVEGFGSEASPNQQLYNLALEALQAISQDPDSDLPVRFFELHLLRASGLMPELYQCVECRSNLAPGRHRFSPSLGGTLCADCKPFDVHVRPLSLRALKVLRLLDRSTLPEVPPLRLDPSLAQELKSVLAVAISYWLDREIQTNSFLEHLRREADPKVYI